MVKLWFSSRLVLGLEGALSRFYLMLINFKVLFLLAWFLDDPRTEICDRNTAIEVLHPCTSPCFWDPAVTLEDHDDLYMVCATHDNDYNSPDHWKSKNIVGDYFVLLLPLSSYRRWLSQVRVTVLATTSSQWRGPPFGACCCRMQHRRLSSRLSGSILGSGE